MFPLLQRTQERGDVSYLLMGQAYAEPYVVEFDCLIQGCGRAVGEIGGPSSQTTENRAFKLSDVIPLPGD